MMNHHQYSKFSVSSEKSKAACSGSDESMMHHHQYTKFTVSPAQIVKEVRENQMARAISGMIQFIKITLLFRSLFSVY